MGEKKVDRFIFKISDKIGEGSYGQVFKGVDDKTKELVAVKMLSKSVINEDEYLRDGLMNEIKIMRDLRGQNVVRLIDVLETSNNYYIVQEFCDGGDFQHLLKKKKCLSKNDALSFFIDVLMGMMELVKKGIIHRDLKPANILIHKGIYKIAGILYLMVQDFGFSKAIDNFSKQMLTSNVGTPLYQSLQLLKGEKYTSKSDVWSLGFIFYETLYGQTPWTARSIPELIKCITQQPLQFPSDKNIDQSIISMLKGCLSLDEKNRLSWDQLYRHPCFGTSFQFYTNQAKQLEDKATFLVQDLRFKVMKDKIDLETVFHKYDKSGDQSLDIKELTLLLNEIDPKLEREEIEYIFNKIDLDGSNSIDLGEFKKWLEENQVQMSMKKVNQQNIQRRGTQELVKVVPNVSNQPVPDNDEQATFETRQDSQVLNQSKQQPLAYPPLQYNYPPQSGSQQFPPNTQYPQGSSASQQYPPNQQYGNAFAYYNQGSQQFSPYAMLGSQHQYPYSNSQQFPNQNPYPNQYPNYPYPMTASQQQLYQQQYQQPPQYVPPSQMLPPVNQTQAQERATVTIQKLVYAIEKYNINIWELFRKYDKSDSQSLDVKEFGVMLRKIDSQLTDQDINQAFWLFDTDRSQEITFKEFKDGIEFQVKRIQQQKSSSLPYQKY